LLASLAFFTLRHSISTNIFYHVFTLAIGGTVPFPLLVKIDGGNYVPFKANTLAMDQINILSALKADVAFSTHLKDVALDMCAVAALTTKGEKPTPAEEQDAKLLELDKTLDKLVGVPTEGALIFIHVRTSKAAANTTPG
jgi:hypothetical protein